MPRLPGAETVQRQPTARPGSPARVPNLSTQPQTDLGEVALEFADRLGKAEKRVKDREAAVDRVRSESELHEFGRTQFDAYDKTGDFGRKGAPEEFGATLQAKNADILDRYKQTHGKERALELQAVLEHRANVWADTAARRSIDIRDKEADRMGGSFLNSLSARVRDGENPIDLLREGVRWLEGDEKMPGTKNMFRPDQESNFRDLLAKRVWGARFDRLIRTEQFTEAEDLIENPMVQGFIDEAEQRNIFDRIILAKKEAEKGRTPITLSPGQVAIDPKTGKKIAEVPLKPERGKPVALSAGQRLIDPNTGEVLAEVPEKPNTFTLSPGQRVVDAKGQTIAEGPQKEDEPFTLGEGQTRFGPTGEPIAEGAPKRERPVEVGDPTSPTGSRFVPESEAMGKPGRERKPFITILERGRSEFIEKLGAKDAETATKIEADAQTAVRSRSEISRMQAALESGRFTTGVFADTRAFLARALEFAGADVAPESTLGKLVGDAATADTLDSASNRLGIEMADKLSRFTNMSLKFIQDSLPNLTRTPEGNKILLEVMERASAREIKIAEMADQFISTHQTLRPEGKRSFFQAVRDLEETDPIIDDKLRTRIIEGSKTAPRSFKDVFGFMQKEPPPGVTVPNGWIFDSFDAQGHMILRHATRPSEKKRRSTKPVIDPKTGKSIEQKTETNPVEKPVP